MVWVKRENIIVNAWPKGYEDMTSQKALANKFKAIKKKQLEEHRKI